MTLRIPLSAWYGRLQERLPFLGMSATRLLLEEAGLHARIQRCEQYKFYLTKRVKELDPGELPRYLGDKSYDEWMMTYDALIEEARSELEALTAVPDLLERQLLWKSIIIALVVVLLFFFLIVSMMADPIGVLTGNVVGTSSEQSVNGNVVVATLLFLSTIFLITYTAVRMRG
jgi:hypothetical protein